MKSYAKFDVRTVFVHKFASKNYNVKFSIFSFIVKSHHQLDLKKRRRMRRSRATSGLSMRRKWEFQFGVIASAHTQFDLLLRVSCFRIL